MQVHLSEAARAAMTRFCAEQGVTLAALVEVIGLRIARGQHPVSEALIREARRVAAERRLRPKS